MVRERTEKMKPPRARGVPNPYGRPLGAPENSELQVRVIRAALDLFDAAAGPVLADFVDDDVAGEQTLPLATDSPLSADVPADAAFEVTTLRPYYEQWLASHANRTGVGISGVDRRRFRGAIRFLEAMTRGEDADMTERPQGVSREQFLRWVVDDLKAFYLEARMAQYPRASE